MKKLICIWTVFAMLACLAGCGSGQTNAEADQSELVSSAAATSEESTGETEAAEDTEEPESESEQVQEEEEDSAAEPESEPETPDEPEPEPEPEAEPDQEQETGAADEPEQAVSSEEDEEEEDYVQILGGIVERRFCSTFEHCEVDTNKDPPIILLNITEDGMALSATAMKLNGDMREWEDMKADAVEFCNAISEYLESKGFDEIIVAVNLMNDINPENVLLTVMNGVVIQDAFA